MGGHSKKSLDPRVLAFVACMLMTVAGGLALAFPEPWEASPGAAAPEGATIAATSVSGAGPQPAPLPPPPSLTPAQPGPAPEAPPAPPAPEPPDPMRAYRGLGAWVDLYDFGHKESMEPGAIVEELANRGVRTLFLQTSRWTIRNDIANPGGTDAFLELAHARGIQVVGWYLPGFADLDRDVRASLAVLEYASPAGHRFDGFAVDIEDARAVGNQLGRFNQGIAGYSVRLRQAVPPGTVLGAIVPDAKNNERAPGRWAGFPWPELAANFDVILPMAYWSVTKPASCPAHDAVGYMRQVAEKTTALMGAQKPLHLIGGIADCIRSGEVAGYVDVVRDVGSIGGSLYDFLTTHTNPERDAFWEQLGRLNG